MSFVRVPPDSTGKKVYTVEQTIGADTVQTQVIHAADKKYPTQFQAIDVRGSASVRFAEGQPIMSGFGSLKTANERALGVYEASLDTYESLFSVITANGGLLNYTPIESSQVLSVTGVSGSSAKMLTNRYHYYIPGTSNIIKMTVACGDTGKAGNVRRWGAFDDNDGIFFELDGTTLYAVVRSSVSGVVTHTRVAQENWSADSLDGTGWSGRTLDITKINVWWMDYQWLGAGRVRFGIFEPDGSRLVCHQFEHANNVTLPYMRTGTLPIAAENTNTGATGSSSEIRFVCMAIYAEGTYEDYAFWRFADVDRTMSGLNTETIAFSIRTVAEVNSKHNSVIVYPETLNVYCDFPVAVTIWQNTTVTGGTWNPLASVLENNTTGTVSFTGSQKFKTIFFGAGAKAFDLDQYFEKNDEGVMTGANGVAENWTVTVKPLTASATTATINLGYKELW